MFDTMQIIVTIVKSCAVEHWKFTGSVTTDLRSGGMNYSSFFQKSYQNAEVEELL